MNPLIEVGKWLDDDKDYRLSTEEKYNEFVKKRNYKFSSDGDVLVSTGQGLENWRIGKAEAVRIGGKV
jgi:hypothetical protein